MPPFGTDSPPRTGSWILLILCALVFLGFGIGSQGFWEAPVQDKETGTVSQVPRVRNTTEPTEFSRFLELEQPGSTKWPKLAQWSFRGASRLPGPPELTARLPSLVSMFLLWLMVLVLLRRLVGPTEGWWAAAALLSMPLFLLLARTLVVETPVVFLNSLAVFGLLFSFSGQYSPTTRRMARVGTTLTFVLGVLAGGWIWGLVFPLGAYATGITFAGNSMHSPRTRWHLPWWLLLFSIVSFILLVPHLGAWFFPETNPASAVPSAHAPHAVFTAFFARVAFGTFPWSLLVLIGLLSGFLRDQGDLAPEKGVSPRFFAGWLLTALFAGAYHEMRVGSTVFCGLVPLAALGAIFWVRQRHLWWFPAHALLLGLGALLIFRDFAMYPQILPEMSTTYEISSVRLRLGPWLIPLGLGLALPMISVFWRRLEFGTSLIDFWKLLRTQSTLFFLVSWPVHLIFTLAGRGIARIHMPGRVHALWQSCRERLPTAGSRILLPLSSWVFLSYGAWFSLHTLPELTREFSSRPAFSVVSRVGKPEDTLGVFEVSPRPAVIYAGKKAQVLGNDADLTGFMRESGRRFFVFPSRGLGKVDYLARTGGWKYHLLATESPTYMLGVNLLVPGHPDANPLLPFVFSEKPRSGFEISSHLDDKLELVGYDLPRKIERGQKMTVRLVFRVRSPLFADNQVFIHLDPPYGTRITADHDPVRGLLSTRFFSPGTHVVDEHTFKVPKMGFPVGRYGVYVGLFSGGTRVKVTGGAHAGQNRIPLGHLDLLPSRGFFSCSGR